MVVGNLLGMVVAMVHRQPHLHTLPLLLIISSVVSFTGGLRSAKLE